MTNISLTTFADFVAATGTARLTCAREAKRRYDAQYKPEVDYYKGWRDRTDACLDGGFSVDNLKRSMSTVLDARKLENYRVCTDGFGRFIGRKTVVRLDPVRNTWTGAGGQLSVTVNPELHAEFDGSPYIVKYYMKADPLKKQKVNVTLHLLSKYARPGVTVGVLDVRRGKLYKPTVPIVGIDALLEGEALAFKAIWDSL